MSIIAEDKFYAVIIGDIVGSSKLTEKQRKNLYKAVKRRSDELR